MKKLALLFMALAFILTLGADARLMIGADGKIVSEGCVMTYKDQFSKLVRMIRSNSVVIPLK